MNWVYTPNSSVVHCVAYDYVDENLIVFLHGGHSCYVYVNVDHETYEEFIQAASRGSYYAKFIARSYGYYKTTEYSGQIRLGRDTRGTVLADGADPHEDEEFSESAPVYSEPSAKHVPDSVIDKDAFQGCLGIGLIVLFGIMAKSCS